MPEYTTRHILVVEDDVDTAFIVEHLLQGEGYTVKVLRESSQDAFRSCVATFAPDCVLLDGEVPGSYGATWQNAAWLATESQRTPVIMFIATTTALHETEGQKRARSHSANFAAILGKPFDADDSLSVVARATGR